MCGFFGALGRNLQLDDAAAARVSGSLFHRGPDDAGLERGKGWLLGFRRLSILDLSPAGHQPFFSGDRRRAIVFNGEIYNHVELRQELEALGRRFRSTSDTEVLLAAIETWGIEALGRLNGMFAFAYIDLDSRRFLIARDRLGVKPLYLRCQGGELRFASELKALLQWPGTPREIDQVALQAYHSLGYLPQGACIFSGYVKLPPATYMEGAIDEPEIDPRSYWQVTVDPDETSDRSAAAISEELVSLLRDAVRIRLRSDVPIALLLSGGIDSGLVASWAAELGTAPHALVASFAGAEEDETDLARATAGHLGLDLEILPISPPSPEDVDSLVETFDEPFADPSALAMLRICKAARQHATVLLTGDGGDEAFGGYRRYIEAARYRPLMHIPSWLRGLAWSAGKATLPARHAYRLGKATLPRSVMAAVFDGQGFSRDPAIFALAPSHLKGRMGDVNPFVETIWQRSEGRALLARQRQFDYDLYLADDVLVKVDRASMAASTEIRSPFLDYRVVEFAARVPGEFLVKDGLGKVILRDLAKSRLPEAVCAGAKKGFGVPLAEWFRSRSGEAMVRERLISTGDGALWDPRGVASVLDMHLAGQRDLSDLLWRNLVLDAWARHYLPNPASPPASEAVEMRKGKDHGATCETV